LELTKQANPPTSPANRPLPKTEPLSPSNVEKTKQWTTLFRHDLIQCLFSRYWNEREQALHAIEDMLTPARFQQHFGDS